MFILQEVNCGCLSHSGRVEQRRTLADHHIRLNEFLPCSDKQLICNGSDEVSGSITFARLLTARDSVRSNANAALVFEFCYRFISVAKSYFGKVDEESVKSNFVLIYELIDGMYLGICIQAHT